MSHKRTPNRSQSGALDGSTAFKRFAHSLYDGLDGQGRVIGPLDVVALERLRGTERRTAREMLIEQLMMWPDDTRVPPMLLRVGDPGVIPPARAALKNATLPVARLRLAVALRALGSLDDTLLVILELLASGPREARLEAIEATAPFFPGPVDGALAELFDDEDRDVADAAAVMHAARAAGLWRTPGGQGR